MRKSLTVSTVLTSLLLAGCSGQAQQQTPAPETTTSSTATAPTTSTHQSRSKRTAPAKSIQFANPCSIVTEKQWQKFGANQKPKKRKSIDIVGCHYQKGEAGADKGWGVFVAVNPRKTMREFTKAHPQGKHFMFSGYPAYKVRSSLGCLISVDISEKGSLFINSMGRPTGNGPTVDPCPLGKKFAKAAIENLPNA